MILYIDIVWKHSYNEFVQCSMTVNVRKKISNEKGVVLMSVKNVEVVFD